MIVREVSPNVFERIGGNPTLNSLDGASKAPLRTILAKSWTPEDRAKFGIYLAEPFIEPEGMARVGMPIYTRNDKGTVVEVYLVEPIKAPEPDPIDTMRSQINELIARVAALEAKQ